jgi:hypothetical protein
MRPLLRALRVRTLSRTTAAIMGLCQSRGGNEQGCGDNHQARHHFSSPGHLENDQPYAERRHD